jgi:hypothetical protein
MGMSGSFPNMEPTPKQSTQTLRQSNIIKKLGKGPSPLPKTPPKYSIISLLLTNEEMRKGRKRKDKEGGLSNEGGGNE